MTLHLLSGGAAKGLVGALAETFEDLHGASIDGTFGAVGAMKERLFDGAPCDVVILTATLIDALTRSGHVLAGSEAPLGRVRTGIALRSDATAIDVSTREALRAALCASRAIHFPDPERATAGIHFAKVLDALGIADAVRPFLRPYPNGAVAMAALAESTDEAAIGCTQITEIRYTPGVALMGALPVEFELATTYTAAVCSRARDARLARALVALLSGPQAAALRSEGGFE